MTADRVKSARILVAVVALLAALTGAAMPWLTSGGSLVSHLRFNPVAAAALGELSFTEPVRLSSDPSIIIERGTLSFDRSGSSNFRSPENPSTLLAGGHARLFLDGGRISVDLSRGPAGDSGSFLSPAAADPLAKALAGLGIESLALRNAVITIKRPAGEESLENVDADITVRRDRSLVVDVLSHYRGEMLALDVEIGAPKDNGPARTLKAEIAGETVSGSLTGTIDMRPGSLAVTASAANLTVTDVRKAARWLGVRWADGPGLKTFTAEGPATWSDGRLLFSNGWFSADGNRATGSLSLSLAAGRPRVEGTLGLDQLELSPYLGEGSSVSERLWGTVLPAHGAAKDTFIAEADADLRLSAARVSLDGGTVGRGAVSFSLKDRVLAAEFPEIELTGGATGSGVARISLQEGLPRVQVKGRMTDLEMSPLAVAVFGQAIISGPGTLEVDLSDKGPISSLTSVTGDGTIAVEFSPGAKLAASLVNLVSLPAIGSIEAGQPGWGQVAPVSTPCEKLSARLVVGDGLARVERLNIESQGRQASATGTIGLAAHDLDLVVRVPTQALSLLPRKGMKSVGSEAAFAIKGPWAAPLIGAAPPAAKAVNANGGAEAGAAATAGTPTRR